MRIAVSLLAVGAVAALTGCAGPENKLGRGLANMTEIVRGGEMQRSVEQTGLWEGPMAARTTGFTRGFTRTMARTGIGIYEVVSFPFPPYHAVATPDFRLYPDHSIRSANEPWGGLKLPEKPSFPDSYAPGFEGGVFDTDMALGFSGGEVAPGFPGSRFRVFDH